MSDYLLAIPTMGKQGMDDVVSRVFARAPTFTFIHISEGEVENVEVEFNEEAELKQGSGPIVAKKLKDRGVDAVVTGELGPGVRTVLEMNEIQMIQVEPRLEVRQALNKALAQLKSKG